MSSILRKSKVQFLFSLSLDLESEVLGQNADLSTSVSDSQVFFMQCRDVIPSYRVTNRCTAMHSLVSDHFVIPIIEK